MGITYAAGPGTHITTHAVAETCINQADQIGSNTVVVTDDYTTSENGQSGNGTNGIGLSYVGRLVKKTGSNPTEIRRCTAAAAIGTPTVANSWLLTVHEDWDNVPVVTTDALAIPYELADIEDGTASNGIGFDTRTGFFTLTNDLTIDSGAGIQILDGTVVEVDDNGSTATFFGVSGGWLYSGYEAGGQNINGGTILAVNNVTGEPLADFQAGCHGIVRDMTFWGQLIDMDFNHAATADMEFYATKWLNVTNELVLYDALVVDCRAYGKAASTAIVRVDDGTVCDGLILSNVQVLDSAADTTAETITIEGVLFSGVPGYVVVRQNKTWDLIDPVWDVTTYTQLTWTGTATGNELNDRRSIKVTVQNAAGVKKVGARVFVYEDTQLADLVLELTTAAVTGYIEGSFVFRKHATNSVTTTYGGHALRVNNYGDFPFVAAQPSDEKFNGTVVLNADPAVSEPVQATAITAGSGVLFKTDTNPSETFKFTLGSGALAVGMILTFSPSGAVGTITESLDGNSVAGTVHLKDRNATAIGDTDTFSRTGGTAGTFSGTYTASSRLAYSRWIDGGAKSKQVIHDYLAARMAEASGTFTAEAEVIHEWGRANQAKPLYLGSNGWFTERALLGSFTAIDSYSESNQSSSEQLWGGATEAAGQSFTGSTGLMGRTRFYLKKTGSPTGDITAKLYSHTGTFGSSSQPGTLLATSDPVASASLTTSYALVSFEFPTPYLMVGGTKYVIVVEFTGGDVSNSVDAGMDSTTPSHGGNEVLYNAGWDFDPGRDSCFYTEIADAEGVIVVNAGVGTVEKFTSDTGGTYLPPVSLTITYNGLVNGSEVRVTLAGTLTAVAGIESVTGNSFSWNIGAGVAMDITILGPIPSAPSPPNVAYVPIRQKNVSFITDTTIAQNQRIERGYRDDV